MFYLYKFLKKTQTKQSGAAATQDKPTKTNTKTQKRKQRVIRPWREARTTRAKEREKENHKQSAVKTNNINNTNKKLNLNI